MTDQLLALVEMAKKMRNAQWAERISKSPYWAAQARSFEVHFDEAIRQLERNLNSQSV